MRQDDARLSAQRNDDPVRGAEHVGWQGHWAVPESAPASRIPQVLAPPRPRVSRGLGIASGAGQLRHPQNSGSTEVAETPWALCTALYSHQFPKTASAVPPGVICLHARRRWLAKNKLTQLSLIKRGNCASQCPVIGSCG